MTETSSPSERPYPLDHEGRIARLEGIVEQVDVRLGRVEDKIDANGQAIHDTRKELETKIDANGQAIHDTRKELETKFEAKTDRLLRWVIALHAATWGLIGALKLFG